MSHTQDARLARGRKAKECRKREAAPTKADTRVLQTRLPRRWRPCRGGHQRKRAGLEAPSVANHKCTRALGVGGSVGGRRRRSDAVAHCSTHKVYTGLQLNSFTGSREGPTRSCGTEGVSGLRDSLLHERVYCIRVNDVRPKGFPRPGACLSGVDGCDWVETTCGDM